MLENVPCALEKKVYSSAFAWNVLKISMRFISSNVSFKTCVFLLIFCFGDLSIGVSGVLKSPLLLCYIFSHSEGCLFTLLIVSFVVQKLLSLITPHLFIFALISWLQSPSAVNLEPRKIKSAHLLLFSPILKAVFSPCL